MRLRRERNQRFGAGHLIDILLGKRTERVGTWGHDQLSTFGVGGELSDQQWRAVARQLLASGVLAVSADGHSTLEVTDDSWTVLRGERQVQLRQDAIARAQRPSRKRGASPGAAKSGSAAASGLAPGERELFERLRAWRADTARAASVPAYVVFPDATLVGIVRARPESLDALASVSGVGVKKLELYGPAVLALIAGD